MAMKGRPVPDLVNKPELPVHQRILIRCYNDLNREGYIPFSEYRLWCETYGIRVSSAQFEFIWEALNIAIGKVTAWRRKQSPQTSSGKTTGT
jgi:hypothetical protein